MDTIVSGRPGCANCRFNGWICVNICGIMVERQIRNSEGQPVLVIKAKPGECYEAVGE